MMSQVLSSIRRGKMVQPCWEAQIEAAAILTIVLKHLSLNSIIFFILLNVITTF